MTGMAQIHVLTPVCDLPQALGAVADGLTAAYNAVRPEVQSGALPPKVSTLPWPDTICLAPAAHRC